MIGIEERWDDPSKPAEFLRSAGKRGKAKSTSLAESRCAKDSADHFFFIAFIFSPNFVGLETPAMQQDERPFCFSNFKTKQKLGIFTRGIGKSGYS